MPACCGKLESQTDWCLPVPYEKPAPCFHGGAFFEAIGASFGTLERSRDIINADVLDAWFPPSPKVTASLQEFLPWLLRTSPPTGCEGFVTTIAETRGVVPGAILPGAGSSALIFLALRRWLSRSFRVLILDPTSTLQYAHVSDVSSAVVWTVSTCRAPTVIRSNWRLWKPALPTATTGSFGQSQ